MKLLPFLVSSSLAVNKPESCLECEATYVEGIGIIDGSMDCFEGELKSRKTELL